MTLKCGLRRDTHQQWFHCFVQTFALAVLVLLGSVPALGQSGPPDRLPAQAQTEAMTLVPSNAVPSSGTFYSWQGWPPMPADWDPALPVYQIGPGEFLVDDRSSVGFCGPTWQRSGAGSGFSSEASSSEAALTSGSNDTNAAPAWPPTLVPYTGEGIPSPGWFYSIMNCLPPTPWYPLPQLLPLYTDGTGDQCYFYDDSNYDYNDFWEAQAEVANAAAASSYYSGGGGALPDAPAVPPGALWLQPTGLTNAVLSVNLLNATDYVYEVCSTTDLSQTNWSIEREVFPTNQQVMPFTVNQQGRPALFLWARDWTNITSYGNQTKEWWLYKYFGTVNLSDSNLDVNGINTLLYDFTNGINPTNITGLWLQITGITNGIVSLTLNNATDVVYELWSAMSLSNPVPWNIEQEVWPVSNQPLTPFTVEVQDRTNGLFFSARDWTGVTSCGNLVTPEWWLWEYFGTVDVSEMSLDAQGYFTLLYDYQHGRDPNVISFTPQFAATKVSDPNVSATLAIAGGVPSYMAVTVNNTNFAAAAWQPWNSNITVSLGPGNGLYDVWIGLRGLPPDATPTWMETWITLYSAPLTLAVTNVSSNVSQSALQLQGFGQAQLSGVAFDVSNSAGFFPNQAGSITGRYYDTNLLEFTTNYFQSGTIALAPGANTITARAVDFAGDSVTANFTVNYVLDTNPPVLTMTWPPNNMAVSGGNLTIQAQVNDPTTRVTASANGAGAQGIVEQSGAVWLQNVPLVAGTNVVTVTATSAAGNMSTTSLNVVQATVSLTIDPLPTNQLNLPAVTVTGTVGAPSYNVWANGVAASVANDGTWEADNVPVNPSGTAIITAEAGTDLTNILAAQTLDQPQPAVVSLESIFFEYETYSYSHITCGWFAGNTFYAHSNFHLNWNDTSGGLEADSSYGLNGDLQKYSYSDINPLSVAGGLEYWNVPWVYADFHFNEADDSCGIDTYTGPLSARTQVVILPSGQTQAGTTNLYLVSASAMEYSDPDNAIVFEGGDVPLPAAWLTIQGQPLTNNVTTNDDGSIWGMTAVSAAAGTPVDVTPVATQFYSNNVHTFNELATEYILLHQTECTAAGNTDNTRTTIGIGEVVDLSGMPGNTSWSLSGGGSLSTTNGSGTTFTASSSPGPSTVIAQVATTQIQLAFNVIAPSGITVSVKSNADGTTGTNEIGATTIYQLQLNPTSVSFVNIQGRENFPQSAIRYWPNGDTSITLANIEPFGVNGAGCLAIFLDTQIAGMRPINSLYNGTNYTNFSYLTTWADEYQNGSGQWIPFMAMTRTTQYRGSDQACQIILNGVPGTWQGPWP
jgi:hypothetical protein